MAELTKGPEQGWGKEKPYRIFSRWVRAEDRSNKSVYAAIQEAYLAGRPAEPVVADDLPPPADQHHFDTACDDRPYCVIPRHHDVDALGEQVLFTRQDGTTVDVTPKPGEEAVTTYRTDVGRGIVASDPDRLVAVVVNGDTALAERIAWLLTYTCPTCMGPQRETVGMVCQTCGTDYAPEDAPCQEETWSWKHFSTEAVDGYWIRCTLSGPHDEHADTGNTGLTWRSEPEAPGAPAHGTGR